MRPGASSFRVGKSHSAMRRRPKEHAVRSARSRGSERARGSKSLMPERTEQREHLVSELPGAGVDGLHLKRWAPMRGGLRHDLRHDLRLYLRLVGMQVRSQAQYKVNLAMDILTYLF